MTRSWVSVSASIGTLETGVARVTEFMVIIRHIQFQPHCKEHLNSKRLQSTRPWNLELIFPVSAAMSEFSPYSCPNDKVLLVESTSKIAGE